MQDKCIEYEYCLNAEEVKDETVRKYLKAIGVTEPYSEKIGFPLEIINKI